MKKLSILITALLLTTALSAQQIAQTAAQRAAAQAAQQAAAQNNLTFHGFTWKTSLDTFRARMGNPLLIEESGGFLSLIYENVQYAGNRALLVAYFSDNGLEGGMYYFNTIGLEEIMICYDSAQKEITAQYGLPPAPPAGRYEELMREMRAYESCWILPGGYIHLKANTRTGAPVTLWISFPTLTEILDG